MIIPEVKDREHFYNDLVVKCEGSLPDRKQSNQSYRQYYLQGSLGNQKNVMQNRLRDKVNLLSSFLYAQETTKFGIKFAAHVPHEQRLYADILREISLDNWHDTDTDRSLPTPLHGPSSTVASSKSYLDEPRARNLPTRTALFRRAPRGHRPHSAPRGACDDVFYYPLRAPSPALQAS